MTIKISPETIGLWIFFQIVSIASTLFILFTPAPSNFKLLFLLPLSYFIINFVYINSYAKKVLYIFPLLLVHGLIFIRMVIAPFFLAISGFHSVFALSSCNHISVAVFVMIYEAFFVYFIALKKVSNSSRAQGKPLEINESIYHSCKIILLLFTVLLLVLLLITPSAALLYRSGLGYFDYSFTGFNTAKVISQYATSVKARFGMVTFRYLFNIARIVVPCITIIMMKYREKSQKAIIFVTVILIVVLDFLIMDDTLAYSVCFSLIVFVFLAHVLDDSKLLINALLISFIIVLLYFISRFFLTASVTPAASIAAYISGILQSYFSGVTNIAAGLNMPDASIGERAKLFVYEILRGVPYATTIFGLDSTSMGQYFNSCNGSVGQIVPTISSCCYYLGTPFAPLFSCILTALGIRAGAKEKSAVNPLFSIAYITVALYSALGISMYSLEIICVGLFSVALPIYLLGILAIGKKQGAK